MRFAAVVLLLSLPGLSLRSHSLTLHDAFQDLSLPLWDGTAFDWRVENGRLVADVGLPARTTVVVPHLFRTVVTEVTITPLSASAKGWKVAGIGVYRDAGNFWHLALVERPDADTETQRRYVELSQMRGGSWLAQSNLRSIVQEGGAFDWQYGSSYRLRLELTPAGIDGKVFAADGTQVSHLAYAFSAIAVTDGRPSLRVSGMNAAFAEFSMTADETTAVPLPPADSGPSFPPYGVQGSGVQSRLPATGFFQVENDDGVWWLVDPRGERFYAVGTDHVNYFTHWCQKLGHAPYHRNCERLHGSIERWAASTVGRLLDWGFNLLGANNVPQVRHSGLAHTLFASFGADFADVSALVEKTTWTGFPNVFDPRWEAYCNSRAQTLCTDNREDPWLLGYFLDNELEWYGKSHRPDGIWTAAMAWPAHHSGKQAIMAHLRATHGDVATFNQVWQQNAPSWEAVHALDVLPAPTAAAQAVQLAWLENVAERYFAVAAAAVRRADPNHLVIGSRFAGNAPEWAWQACSRHCDVVTFNAYPRIDFDGGDLSEVAAQFTAFQALVGRPMMITEWSFPALDSGLPCRHGAGMRVDTQEQKAACYEVMQHLLFRLPFMVGSNYFMWADEPELGISDTFPEDSNYGLVNVHDEPYAALTGMAARLNPMAVALHAGDLPEVYLTGLTATAEGIRVELRNSGPRVAEANVQVSLGGDVLSAPRVVFQGGGTAAIETSGAPLTPGLHRIEARLVPPADWLPRGCRGSTSLVRHVYRKHPGEEAALILANSSRESIGGLPVLLPRSLLPAAPWGLLLDNGAELPCVPMGDSGCLAWVPPLAGGTAIAAVAIAAAPLARHDGIVVERTAAGGYRVDTGLLRLEHDGSSGNVVDRVFCQGVLLGRYNPLIWQQPGGQNQWTPATAVTAIAVEGLNGSLVITVTARGGTPAGVITAVDDQGAMAARQTTPVSFEVTHRLVVGVGLPFFVTQCLAIRNTDPERPLQVMAPFFYLPSSIGGDAAGDLPGGGKGVPNYYRATQAASWHDAAVGARYGCLPMDNRITASFWLDQGGGQHPDARIELDPPVSLQPGETYSLPDAPALLVYGALDADGSPAAWQGIEAALTALPHVQVMAAE